MGKKINKRKIHVCIGHGYSPTEPINLAAEIGGFPPPGVKIVVKKRDEIAAMSCAFRGIKINFKIRYCPWCGQDLVK